LADSLKVLQYTYCKLPIIAPSVIPAYHRKNFFYYNYYREDTIKSCIIEALGFNKEKFNIEVNSWGDLVRDILK
jgi:2-beta-glucuronyltransferase